ncbi:hypothetical protein DPMN_120940, partial [Dreissena polymorpha]
VLLPEVTWCQDVPVDISQSLSVLIQEEANIRSQLDADLTALAQTLDALTNLQNNVTCGCPGRRPPVAFSATLTNEITSLGTNQQVPFDKVLTNVGGAYDSRHGEFRAPYDGTYEFSVSLYMRGARWAGLEIVREGVAVSKVRTGDGSEYTMAGTTVTLALRAGQDVWVRHIDESDSNAIDGETFPTFSGHLLQV